MESIICSLPVGCTDKNRSTDEDRKPSGIGMLQELVFMYVHSCIQWLLEQQFNMSVIDVDLNWGVGKSAVLEVDFFDPAGCSLTPDAAILLCLGIGSTKRHRGSEFSSMDCEAHTLELLLLELVCSVARNVL
ncbi:hypothetical protein RIF29_27766 [Crotalaria pallida]|uniref:Uncharacterized protein n=1 Tax=Crotalaria pallida TaxID=3830 RepID=A0AAN9EQM8_CROPI